MRYLESKEEEEALSELSVLPPTPISTRQEKQQEKSQRKLEGTHPLE